MKLIRTLALLAALSPLAAAQEAKKAQDALKKTDVPLLAVPVSDKTLSLAECLAIGAEKQPAIRAAVFAQDSSRTGLQSLKEVGRFAKALSPDLPYRIKQGETGLVVADADVQKALQENRYDIIRLYYTYVYARQQDATAGAIVDQLNVYYEVADGLSKVTGSKITSFQLYDMSVSIAEVNKARVAARAGQSKALAALKEAMGVEQCFNFLPADKELPVMGGTVTEAQVVACALSRRPEMAMAAAGVDAFQLEICAQNAHRVRPRVPTLAAGSDLHSRYIPGPHRNGEYRPGALAPDMPTLLVGPRADRVLRATDLFNRQTTVFDKTRDLVTLEAVNSYHDWVAATEILNQAKTNYENSKKTAEDAQAAAAISKDQAMLIKYQAMLGKYQADFVNAAYEHLKALATLERVTAGGVAPDWMKINPPAK